MPAAPEFFPDISTPGSFDAVIVANGDPPSHPVATGLLHAAPFVCCCDGAIARFGRADAVVGDGDSIPSWARSEYRGIFTQIDEQDDNDLTKATRFCLSRGMRRLVYLGATGRREDHTLGNIALMVRYRLEMGVSPLMATDHGWFVVAQGPADFASRAGQQVSIFNFGCTRIAQQGLAYDSYAYSQWWQGTLNEATTSRFSIMADGSYLVYRTYETKKKS